MSKELVKETVERLQLIEKMAESNPKAWTKMCMATRAKWEERIRADERAKMAATVAKLRKKLEEAVAPHTLDEIERRNLRGWEFRRGQISVLLWIEREVR